MVDYIDSRGESVDFEPRGILYVKYDDVNIENGFKLEYAKEGDVGLDLPVIIDKRLKVEPFRDYYINYKEGWFDIPPSGLAEVPCGLSIKVSENSWANIKPRSSTAWRRRLVVNEGVIDSGYVGPLFILVFNPNLEPIRVHAGDRLAQLIIIPKYPVEKIMTVSYLPKTQRGNTGFGSSGGVIAVDREIIADDDSPQEGEEADGE
jgi:dUTP pyrophosphatase